MRDRLFHGSLAFVLLASLLALASAAAGAQKDWDPFVAMDRQLFPSLIVSTAAIEWPGDEHQQDQAVIGDPYGLVGALVPALPAGTRVRLVVRPNRYMQESVVEGIVEQAKKEYEISPKINWNYEALLRARQVAPLNVVMELFENGRSRGVKSVTAVVRSLNDCPIYLPPTDAEGRPAEKEEDVVVPGEDLGWMFAAYVNENHPWVEKIIKEALDTGVVNAFTGYQSDDPEQVIMQVFAIWNVMQRKGMRYSNITTPSAESSYVASQHVRLFDEAVNATQANCVDGTVLLASILRKIGIESYLVLLPGHMILGFDVDAEGNQMIGLETTLMGETDLGKFDRRSKASPKREQMKNQASWRAFEAAVDAGTEELQKNKQRFGSEEADDAEYQIISVSEARQAGILPLASYK